MMNGRTFPLKLPNSVKNAAARFAKVDGVSLNQVIAAAVAEKAGTSQAARVFLPERLETRRRKTQQDFAKKHDGSHFRLR